MSLEHVSQRTGTDFPDSYHTPLEIKLPTDSCRDPHAVGTEANEPDGFTKREGQPSDALPCRDLSQLERAIVPHHRKGLPIRTERNAAVVGYHRVSRVDFNQLSPLSKVPCGDSSIACAREQSSTGMEAEAEDAVAVISERGDEAADG